MVKVRVLLVDNHRPSLKSWGGTLRREDYDVTEASSASRAKMLLDKGGFDLAILDLHLERDEDETDESGLNLAKAYCESVPIIMLSGRPTLDAAIRALRDGRSAIAVAFVKKKDGPEALLKAMAKAIMPKVFVAHGHDEAATAAVVKFIEDGGAKALVLREQPVASQAILEAFEKHTNVQFAIILVTPDDVGTRRGTPLQPRVLQNVDFELDFFLAKLGRNRVVALYKEAGEPIEVPSNYHGVFYREMDAGGGWRVELAREMKEAGIELHLI
ncbi:MAG: TIR domain-containing protein [Thermoanaerobaculia bacterium]